jgi:hypothetical protein
MAITRKEKDNKVQRFFSSFTANQLFKRIYYLPVNMLLFFLVKTIFFHRSIDIILLQKKTTNKKRQELEEIKQKKEEEDTSFKFHFDEKNVLFLLVFFLFLSSFL